MRRLAVIASALAFAMPFAAGAVTADELKQQIAALLQQITALQTQIQTTQSPQTTSPVTDGLRCVFTRTLSLGASGTEVRSLQQYLTTQNLLAANSVTGYFTATTETAVQRWQASHGIISSGTASSTGYGVVGPRTRALLARNCALPPSPSVQTQCPLALQPVDVSCAGSWSPVTGDNGCTVAWKCSVPLPGYVSQNSCNAISLVCPVGTHEQIGANCSHTCVGGVQQGVQQSVPYSASPLSGPASLAVTFSVSAAADTYSVNFGDGFAAQMQLQGCGAAAAGTCAYQVQHMYAAPGMFTATFSGGRAGTLGTTLISVR